MTRLFIALPIDRELYPALQPVYEFFRSHDTILKAVSPEHYHITVKFLGECDGNIANAIESTFLEIPIPSGDIPIVLTGMGAFPDIKRPNVIWAGLETDAERISLLHKCVERYAANFRFKEEKRGYTPHLTLARVKSGRKISGDLLKFVEKNRNMRFGESAFRRLSLFSSKLTPDGPVYTELKAIHL